MKAWKLRPLDQEKYFKLSLGWGWDENMRKYGSNYKNIYSFTEFTGSYEKQV